jgi:hypothetical protein
MSARCIECQRELSTELGFVAGYSVYCGSHAPADAAPLTSPSATARRLGRPLGPTLVVVLSGGLFLILVIHTYAQAMRQFVLGFGG